MALISPPTLTKGEQYTDQRRDYFEESYRQRLAEALHSRRKIGMKLIAADRLVALLEINPLNDVF